MSNIKASSNKGYKRLKVWQESHELVLKVYKVTKKFPREENFGITSQMRRAVVSVAANIVEGQVRNTNKSFLQFLNIANGSLVEVEYYLELSNELSYLKEAEFKIIDQQRLLVGNLLNGLVRSLRNKS